MPNVSAKEPTPYADLNLVLCEVVGRVKKLLGKQFVGAYLQGSFAIGDFNLSLKVCQQADCADLESTWAFMKYAIDLMVVLLWLSIHRAGLSTLSYARTGAAK